MKIYFLFLCMLLPFVATGMHKNFLKEKEKITLDDDDTVLLGNTIISNDIGIVNILISRENIDLNAIEIKDNTKSTNRPLHLACLHPNTLDIAKLLLAKSININLKDQLGDTALHWAVRKENAQAIAFLLKNNAKINIYNKAGKDAFYWDKKYKHLNLKRISKY